MKAVIVRLPTAPSKFFLEVVMSSLRVVIVAVIVSIIALPSVAQTSDTGPVAFPQVTNTNIVDCFGYPGTIPGPGGKVFFLRGGFYNRNGVIYLGTNTHDPGCFGEVNIQFAPVATDINFTLTNFAPQIIHVNGVDYNLGRNAVIGVTVPGPAVGVSITAGIDFAITDLVITQHPVNDGVVRFDLSSAIPPTSDRTKILISKATWDIGYPSAAQLAPDSSGNPQVKIAGTLLDALTSQPKSGPVYLRVEDPPDTALYRGSDAHQDDNEPGPAAVLSSTTAQADAQGRFEATLTIRSRTAGDNYQIVGSADQNFKCNGGICPHSAIFTLWKRTYVEDASMFRSGAFLTDGADAGTTTFGVTDPVPFQNVAPGAPLKLIHADTGSGEGFYWDIVYFKSMQRDSNGRWNLTVNGDPGLTQPIPRDYGTSVGGVHAPSYLPWAPLLADAVGVVGADTYAASTAFVPPTLADAFVEMKQIPAIIDEMPHVDVVPSLPDSIQYSDHWFEHSDGVLHKAMPNFLHRIGASQSAPIFVPATNGVPAGWGVELGVTTVGSGNNVSFIFSQRIDELSMGPALSPRGTLIAPEYQNTNPAVVNARTTAHETVHFWIRTQRPGITDRQGHCHEMQYDDPSLTCLMHQPAGANGLDSAKVHMHYDKLSTGAVDSEYLLIRRAADPVPQN